MSRPESDLPRHETHRPKGPVPPPPQRHAEARTDTPPDLRLEEIEEKHIPKDRNIFDK